MGARASVSFKNNHEESIAVFSHWGGDNFHTEARLYFENLKKHIKNNEQRISYPLYRLEPATVVLDFIRHLTKSENRIKSDLYLERNESEGDNNDYGHKVIDLTT